MDESRPYGLASEPLTTADVASEFKIAESTLRYYRMRNEGPASYRVGRRVFYRRGEVERWISVQEAATTRGGDAA